MGQKTHQYFGAGSGVELTHNKMITFALSLSKPVMNLSNGVSVVRQAHHERFCNPFIDG
jgi:hypothetical protein